MLKRYLLSIALLMLAISAHAAIGVDEAQERRIRSGLKLFRAVLAADEDIASKADSSGALCLSVVFYGNRQLAEGFAAELMTLSSGTKGGIRKLPVKVRVLSWQEMNDSLEVPAGIYVVEEFAEDALQRLVRYGIEHQVIVYSPYEEHVARGVLGGLIIETRVRPYINMKTLRASKVRLKSFFLKVAKRYDP
jgi:hypothetical protein